MRTIPRALLALACAAVLAAPAAASPLSKRCPPDAVKVGTTCIDKYEARVWQIPDPTGVHRSLVTKLKKGKATLADLTAAGATQLGCPIPHTAYPPSFPADGNWTAPVYAVSVPGVLPRARRNAADRRPMLGTIRPPVPTPSELTLARTSHTLPRERGNAWRSRRAVPDVLGS